MSFSSFAQGVLVGCCLALIVPGVAHADPVLSPLGGETAIIGNLPGDQVLPDAALGASGGFLVWQDNVVTTLGSRIRAVSLLPDRTPAGPPFIVSSAAFSKLAGDQENPQVTLLTNGLGLVVWQGGKQGSQQIYGRLVGSAGVVGKGDFRVNTFAKTSAAQPAVASLADGGAVAVWVSYKQDGSRWGVFGQRFSGTGARVGGEFQVNQWTAENQRTPAVAGLANGGFVVAWVSELQRTSASVDVYARLYDSSGVPVRDEFPINPSPTCLCADPVVAASPQGGFAVAWSQNDTHTLTAGSVLSNVVFISSTDTSISTNGWDVETCLFDATGTNITAPFVLNTFRHGDQFGPRLAAIGTNFFAVWTSEGQDGSREGVFGQAFAGDGTMIGSELRINTTTISRQIQPCVASDGAGTFLAVWTSIVMGTGFDLFAQAYSLTP